MLSDQAGRICTYEGYFEDNAASETTRDVSVLAMSSRTYQKTLRWPHGCCLFSITARGLTSDALAYAMRICR